MVENEYIPNLLVKHFNQDVEQTGFYLNDKKIIEKFAKVIPHFCVKQENGGKYAGGRIEDYNLSTTNDGTPVIEATKVHNVFYVTQEQIEELSIKQFKKFVKLVDSLEKHGKIVFKDNTFN